MIHSHFLQKAGLNVTVVKKRTTETRGKVQRISAKTTQASEVSKKGDIQKPVLQSTTKT